MAFGIESTTTLSTAARAPVDVDLKPVERRTDHALERLSERNRHAEPRHDVEAPLRELAGRLVRHATVLEV